VRWSGRRRSKPGSACAGGPACAGHVRPVPVLVPARYVGRQVRVLLRATQVLIYDGSRLVADHERSTVRGSVTWCWTTTWRCSPTSPAPCPAPPPSCRHARPACFTADHGPLLAAAKAKYGDKRHPSVGRGAAAGTASTPRQSRGPRGRHRCRRPGPPKPSRSSPPRRRNRPRPPAAGVVDGRGPHRLRRTPDPSPTSPSTTDYSPKEPDDHPDHPSRRGRDRHLPAAPCGCRPSASEPPKPPGPPPGSSNTYQAFLRIAARGMRRPATNAAGPAGSKRPASPDRSASMTSTTPRTRT